MLADLQRSPEVDPEIAPNGKNVPFRAHFRCFRGCEGEYSLYQVIYTCPKCGGLLEVHHELDALRT